MVTPGITVSILLQYCMGQSVVAVRTGTGTGILVYPPVLSIPLRSTEANPSGTDIIGCVHLPEVRRQGLSRERM